MTLTDCARIDRYDASMKRLQRIWAYLLTRKQRLYRFSVIVVMLGLLAACSSSKPDAGDKSVAEGSVGILFSVDGVTVYRFGDGVNYHYFAVKDGRPDTVTLTNWSESCGKNCTKHVEDVIQLLAAGARTRGGR